MIHYLNGMTYSSIGSLYNIDRMPEIRVIFFGTL